MSKINLTSQIWKEGDMFVAHNPELQVSSCGKNLQEAKKNIKEAIQLFLETTQEIGTLDDILKESGFIKKENEDEKIWKAPELISFEKLSLAF